MGARQALSSEVTDEVADPPSRPVDVVTGTKGTHCVSYCVCCFSSPTTRVVLPCQHKCICDGCAHRWFGSERRDARRGWSVPGKNGAHKTCPVCREVCVMTLRADAWEPIEHGMEL